MSPSTWNLRLNGPTPYVKRRLQPISAYNVSTVRTSEKCSIIANRKSTARFPTSYRWSAYVTHNSPRKWLKKANLSFLWIKFESNPIKSATKFLCVKTSSGIQGSVPGQVKSEDWSWKAFNVCTSNGSGKFALFSVTSQTQYNGSFIRKNDKFAFTSTLKSNQ